MKNCVLFALALGFVLRTTAAQAAIELRTVTKQTQADQWFKFSISMKPHPNGSGATLVKFQIPAEQVKQHQVHGASVFFKEGKEFPFHAPLSLTTNKDGSLSADVTLAKPLLEKAWLGVHVYRNRGSGSGTSFSIDLSSYVEDDDNHAAKDGASEELAVSDARLFRLFYRSPAFKQVKEGVVVVADGGLNDADTVENAYLKANHSEELTLPSGSKLKIISAGPFLDSPDKVQVRQLTRHDGTLELEIVHTSFRAMGVSLRRNLRWRPLMVVPISAKPTDHQVVVTWRALESLPDSKPLDVKPVELSCRFQIRQ